MRSIWLCQLGLMMCLVTLAQPARAQAQTGQLDDMTGFWAQKWIDGEHTNYSVYQLTTDNGAITLRWSRVDVVPPIPGAGTAQITDQLFVLAVRSQALTGTMTRDSHPYAVVGCPDEQRTFQATGRISPDWKTITVVVKDADVLVPFPSPCRREADGSEAVYVFQRYQ